MKLYRWCYGSINFFMLDFIIEDNPYVFLDDGVLYNPKEKVREYEIL